MTNFNPYNPSTLGAEWKPITYGQDQLFGTGDAIGMVIDSSVTQTVASIIVPHYWNNGSGYAKLWAEIYNLADLGEGPTETTTTIRPNEDKTRSGVVSNTAATTNLYSYIDDTSFDSSADTDYVTGAGSGCGTPVVGNYLGLQFDTSSIPASSRPVAVYIDVRMGGFNSCVGFCCIAGALGLNWFSNATDYGEIARQDLTAVIADNTYANYTFGPFYYDPSADEPWGRKTIVDLDTNTLDNLRLNWIGNGVIRVSYVAMRVVTIPEKRIAVGGTTKASSPGTSLQTALTMTLKDPLTDTANWSKTNGVDYVVVLRRLADPLTTNLTALLPSIPYISGATVSPNVHGAYREVITNGVKGGLLEVSQTNDEKTYPIVLSIAGAYSVDGNPYHSVTPKPCHTSSTLKSLMTGATNTSPYIVVRALLALYTNTPTADLSVKLKRNSDNVQFGSTKTITTADLGTAVFTKDGYTFYEVDFNMPSGQTLAAATTYYLEFTSSTIAGSPWYVAMLDATESNALTGDITYGGSTAYADVAGAVQNGDFAVTLSSIPDPLTGLTAVIDYEPLPSMGDTSCCDGCERAFVHLDWTSSSLSSAFLYYEIQRSEDQTTWVTIGYEDTEATSQYDDNEALRGTIEYYRVRVVRTDGVTSAWSPIIQQLVPVGEGDIVYLTSNEVPSLSTGFVRLGPDSSFNFLSAGEVKHLTAHNRDFQIRLAPLENRGVSFILPMLVNIGPSDPVNGAGVQAFDTVRNICENKVISYVCVLTADGERFFGSLLLPTGDRKESQKSYVANALFIETTDVPSSGVL